MKYFIDFRLVPALLWFLFPSLSMAGEADLPKPVPASELLFAEPSMLAIWEQMGWWWLPLVAILGVVCWMLWELWKRGKGSFQKNALRWNILFVFGAVLVVLLLNAFIYVHEFQRNSRQGQQQLLNQSKKLLTQRVEFIIDFIEQEKQNSERVLRDSLKYQVDQAYLVAESLVAGMSENLPQDELVRRVVEGLRPIRYRDGRGYMFATRMDGTSLLFADHPELEGLNLLKNSDLDGIPYIREMVRLSKEQGGGFVSYRLSKPGSKAWDHRKLSYVRYFEPLDCYIGTGEYLDDFEVETKKAIFDRLDALQFSGSLTLFSVDYDGMVLFGPGRGRNMLGATDRNGVKMVQELLAAAQEGGGFVRYHMPAVVDVKQYPKISYSKPIPGWGAYVGAGVNLDNLEAELFRSQNQLKELFLKQIVETAFLIPLIAFIFLLMGRRLSAQVNRNVSLLEASLGKAAEQDIFVDTDQIEYDEFIHIAESANRMLKERQLATRELMDREENLSVTLDSIGDAVIVTDPEGRITRMNPIAEQLSGWTSEDAYGQDLPVVFHIINAYSRKAVENPVQKVIESGKIVGLANHTILVAKDGTELQIADSAAPIKSDDSEIHGVILVFRDVTEEYALSQALNESEERFRTMFDNAPLMIALLDPQGVPTFVNEHLLTMTGHTSDDLKKRPFIDIVSHSKQESFSECLTSVVSGEERVCRLDSSCAGHDGRLLEFDMSLASLNSAGGENRHIMLMAKDITQRRQHEQRLEWLGMHDDLTGLANRAKLMEFVDSVLNGANLPTDYWLLLTDLDRFKNINDNYGHAIGDIFLREVGRRLQMLCPEGGLAARLSGDEFVIVGEFAGEAAAILFADELRRELCNPVECNGLRLQVEASTGIVAIAGDTSSESLRRADLAMYQIKRSKSAGGVQVYNDVMDETVKGRQRLEEDIKAAIAEPEQFQLYYQPIWVQKNGALKGFEALLRWDHPTKGRVVPNDFIPLAEESELIVALGKTVLRLACRDIDSWRERFPELGGEEFRVSINISPQHLMTVDLVEDVKQALNEFGVDASSICLEITETAIMEDPAVAARRINALKELGLHIAIDDFGTGYSSLSYLNQFNVDIIKLDRSLTQGIDVIGTSLKVSGAVIQLAHDLDLEVVAEGLETRSQLEVLGQLNCDYLQGFLTGHPLPVEDVWSVLEDRCCPLLQKETIMAEVIEG